MKDLLSTAVGVPLALMVLLLLFSIDSRQVIGARRSHAVVLAASAGFVAVVVLIVVRFAEYA